MNDDYNLHQKHNYCLSLRRLYKLIDGDDCRVAFSVSLLSGDDDDGVQIADGDRVIGGVGAVVVDDDGGDDGDADAASCAHFVPICVVNCQ